MRERRVPSMPAERQRGQEFRREAAVVGGAQASPPSAAPRCACCATGRSRCRCPCRCRSRPRSRLHSVDRGARPSRASPARRSAPRPRVRSRWRAIRLLLNLLVRRTISPRVRESKLEQRLARPAGLASMRICPRTRRPTRATARRRCRTHRSAGCSSTRVKLRCAQCGDKAPENTTRSQLRGGHLEIHAGGARRRSGPATKRM